MNFRLMGDVRGPFTRSVSMRPMPTLLLVTATLGMASVLVGAWLTSARHRTSKPPAGLALENQREGGRNDVEALRAEIAILRRQLSAVALKVSANAGLVQATTGEGGELKVGR